MKKPTVEVQLSQQQDGFGFYYGEVYVDGEHHILNVMPPENEWAGDIKMEDCQPHKTDWVIFLDGNEIARARARDDLVPRLKEQLLSAA